MVGRGVCSDPPDLALPAVGASWLVATISGLISANEYVTPGHCEKQKILRPKFFQIFNYPQSFGRGGAPKRESGFGITYDFSVSPTVSSAEMVLTSFMGSSASVATTTDCNWRTSSIERFFNESYLQIAEESSQGQGPLFRHRFIRPGG